MFTRLTQQPEGLPIYVRTARIAAFARTEEGDTRIFLGGPLSVLVAENEVEVLAAISAPAPDDDL